MTTDEVIARCDRFFERDVVGVRAMLPSQFKSDGELRRYDKQNHFFLSFGDNDDQSPLLYIFHDIFAYNAMTYAWGFDAADINFLDELTPEQINEETECRDGLIIEYPLAEVLDETIHENYGFDSLAKLREVLAGALAKIESDLIELSTIDALMYDWCFWAELQGMHDRPDDAEEEP